MTTPIQFAGEEQSNAARRVVARREAAAQRTFTPSQLVIARSAGVFHWTPEGRCLYDYTSGVLVANLGHNSRRWWQRIAERMGWAGELFDGGPENAVMHDAPRELPGARLPFVASVPLTAYNAITLLEAEAARRLVHSVQACPGGGRLDRVLWAASGSEAIQKVLWACLNRDSSRDLIVATRYGFHGKKGLAGAVTGCEADPGRDPRVVFISFPMAEVEDFSKTAAPVDLSRYQLELQALSERHGRRLNCLITEPYLGGAGSYHPPPEYLRLLERFCREHDVLLILDEVQSNFGRTGAMYAFETYGLEPDFVVLGKGLGNGVPVAAVVGRGDILAKLDYGLASDTYSAHPLGCAAVLATLDEFESTDVLAHCRSLTPIFRAGLEQLKETGLVAKVRGEGMVFGIECCEFGGLTGARVAVEIVMAAYLGNDQGEGLHLLGPLAGNVIRISPPLVITQDEARRSLDLLHTIVNRLAKRLRQRHESAAPGQ
ncbi:MAG: aminotransferase class III-fold pyridoxal phosphate-dependent enzyme [Planctomycetaceae bacterium]